jgi:hypothetical protein
VELSAHKVAPSAYNHWAYHSVRLMLSIHQCRIESKVWPKAAVYCLRKCILGPHHDPLPVEVLAAH